MAPKSPVLENSVDHAFEKPCSEHSLEESEEVVRQCSKTSDLPYIAAGEHLTRLWLCGWSASSLGYEVPQQDSRNVGHQFEDEFHAFLEGDGPLLGELYALEARPVGTGSFGACFSSSHSGKSCCLKIVDRARAGDDYRMKIVEDGMFHVLLRKTPHENVVTHYDFLESPLHYYVVMESLDGPDLFDQFLADYPVTENYIQTIMKQVFAALQQLVSDSIVHRDVKLENFRYKGENANSELKLLDFGFARRANAPWEEKISGTLMYLAPEIVSDTAAEFRIGYSPASDAWAAGVVFCMLLTGREPFTEREIWNLGRENGQSIRDRLLASTKCENASPEAKDLLGKLLMIDPKARITAEEALRHPWFKIYSTQYVDVPREVYMRGRDSSRISRKFKNEPVDVARSSRNQLSSIPHLNATESISRLSVASSAKTPCLNSPSASSAGSPRVQKIPNAGVINVPAVSLPNAPSSVSLSSDDDQLFCYD